MILLHVCLLWIRHICAMVFSGLEKNLYCVSRLGHETTVFETSAGKAVEGDVRNSVNTPFLFHPPPNLCLCLNKSSGGDFFQVLILGCQKAAELCILCFLFVLLKHPILYFHFICCLTIMHFMMTVAFENSICFQCRYRRVCSYFWNTMFQCWTVLIFLL